MFYEDEPFILMLHFLFFLEFYIRYPLDALLHIRDIFYIDKESKKIGYLFNIKDKKRQ